MDRQRAWQQMRERLAPALPRNAVEHALWTFHEQDSLAHWLAKAGATAPAEAAHVVERTLAAAAPLRLIQRAGEADGRDRATAIDRRAARSSMDLDELVEDCTKRA